MTFTWFTELQIQRAKILRYPVQSDFECPKVCGLERTQGHRLPRVGLAAPDLVRVRLHHARGAAAARCARLAGSGDLRDAEGGPRLRLCLRC